MASDHLTKLNISHALGDRSTRVAVLIVENIKNLVEMIEEQPSAVVEALIDHSIELNRTERNTPKRELREHYIKWCETVLEEAKRRERRLLHGITGIPISEDDELGPDLE
jgi:hypothetical protein